MNGNLTSEQIGEGYRLLAVGETVPEKYEFWYVDRWVAGRSAGHVITETSRITRRVKI